MPPPSHLKVTFSGVLGSRVAPVEEWSFGLSFTPGSLTSSTDAQNLTALQAVADNMPTPFSALNGQMTQSVHLTRVRASYIGPEGKTLRAANGQYLHADHIASTGGGTVVGSTPYNVALAITLDSQFAGPTGRGRFFIPCPVLDMVMTTGLMDSTRQNSMAAAAEAFVEGAETQANLPLGSSLVIASGGSALRGLSPALHNVNQIRVGAVYDALSTRKRGLEENYITRAV